MKWLLATLIALPNIVFAADLNVRNAWIPTSPPGAMTHSAYVTLENNGMVPRDIILVSVAGFAAAHLHQSVEKDGISSMSLLHQVQIPANSTLEMVPGGLHLMLMRPDIAIKKGDLIAITVEFANGDTLKIDALVRDRNEGS